MKLFMVMVMLCSSFSAFAIKTSALRVQNGRVEKKPAKVGGIKEPPISVSSGGHPVFPNPKEPILQPIKDPIAMPVDPIKHPKDPIAQPIKDPIAVPIKGAILEPVKEPAILPVKDVKPIAVGDSLQSLKVKKVAH